MHKFAILLALLSTVLASTTIRPQKREEGIFTNCSPQQIIEIGDAATSGDAIATATLAYTESLSGATPRWNAWFGNYTPARKDQVAVNLGTVARGTLLDSPYHCKVCPEIYANAYRLKGNDAIFVCKSFFDLQDSGFQTRAGALIAAGLEPQLLWSDKYTNSAEAHQLAASNPSKATTYSANYRYYAVNPDNLN